MYSKGRWLLFHVGISEGMEYAGYAFLKKDLFNSWNICTFAHVNLRYWSLVVFHESQSVASHFSYIPVAWSYFCMTGETECVGIMDDKGAAQ